MRTLSLFVLTVVAASSAVAQSDAHSSKTPPEGPPWVRSFTKARAEALERGKPIFVYSTKTY